ncbi:S-adenosyl-L-methionine-dependent methyltransferase [Dothidotthia symphoricarpi CBS 119687]|uniref:S-adenosyl-L-methionine-dependent methyltransferase n=1 Tax=Dothidotthia symphoricarpi CBS 119687 TaxID=1392245 RepID=A0A6A5ZXX8_9PLEO|nr:S-adenosyl-L-methionine-dependent methyltransferase [Dothidotthia symphoricarpi CBS 119687]KAF2123875.1 S-adenosyl-L-methionine-dependent methyltransferase [Dothidotthia symphoricarpi CBS 119687]
MESILLTIEVATEAAQKEELPEHWRIKLLDATTNLVTALQKPKDVLVREAFWLGRFMAMRVLHQLGVFRKIVEKGSVTSAELAKDSQADQLLLERFLRVMTASGYVTELDDTTYGPNKLTTALVDRHMEGMVEAIFDMGIKTMAMMPDFLAKTGYKNPDDQFHGPLQYRYESPGQDFFSILIARPALLEAFTSFFEGDKVGKPDWVDWFPVKERLLDDPTISLEKNGVLFVDVAGGRGQDLLAFKRRFPEYPGKYHLFDQPHIVRDHTLDLGDRVEKISFNFFQDQVTPGARLYYMKFIMHDWSDEKCLLILSNVTTSMKKGFSQLIIEDYILPTTGTTTLPAIWDMQMMTYLAAMERTEKQWRALLGKAGLSIEGFYQPPHDGTGIIVTELKQ